MEIKIKRLNETATIPVRGSDEAAGMDIYANIEETIVIKPHETAKIPTGFATKIPKGFVGLVYARSGLATKKGLRPCQGTGVIDSDYRGEWFVPLHNDTDKVVSVAPNERIAQVIFMEYPQVTFTEVLDLPETERGEGGFGSTGQ